MPVSPDRPHVLDRVDRQILTMLQAEGRLTFAELARRVHLTLTPCIERVRRLERDGFIEGYFAKLSAQRLGQTITVFTEITLDHTTPDEFDRFKAAILPLEEVIECHMVAGGFDFLLKSRVRDLDEYRDMLARRILTVRGVRQTQTYFVLEGMKSTHAVRVAEPPRRLASGRRERRGS